MSRILVAEEKHATRYLDASTFEVWAKSCVKLLSERFEQEYINEEEPYLTSEMRSAVALSEEDLAAIPASVRPTFEAYRRNAARAVASAEEANKVYREIKRVVEEQDTSIITRGKGRYQRHEPLAWRLLELRSDYEYERVTIEELEQP